MDLGLGVAEDEGGGGIFDFDDAHEAAVLFHARHEVEDVLGIGHVHVVAAERDEFRLLDELPGRTHDIVGESGGIHAGMHAVPGQEALHLAHVGVEAHRQHAVGFVVDQHLEAVEGEGPPKQEIEQAPRGAHHDLRPLLEGVRLWAVSHSPVNHRDAEADVAAQPLGLLPHLPGKFAGGNQDEGLAVRSFRVQTLQHGQDVRAGLTAPGAGLDHQVPAGEHARDRTGLDGHQVRPARAGGRRAQRFGQLLHGDIAWLDLFRHLRISFFLSKDKMQNFIIQSGKRFFERNSGVEALPGALPPGSNRHWVIYGAQVGAGRDG